MGRSPLSRALNISSPIPFQPNTNSTKTAPASMEANQPLVAVRTGFSEFLSTWRNKIRDRDRPLALAVLMYGWDKTSRAEFRDSCMITARGRIPRVKAGRIRWAQASRGPSNGSTIIIPPVMGNWV